MKKTLVILGHLSLLTTAILAIFFFKERVLYVDAGQQLFEMINEGGYKVYVSRYSMVINQTFPLIAIKLGLPLKWIMIVYSLSFVIVYYICFLVSVYKLKNIAAGLSIAFAPLIIRLVFGHSMGETWLGLGYSALFYAALNYKNLIQEKIAIKHIQYYLLLVALVALNYFTHPGTLFLLGFSLGYTYLKNKAFNKVWPYVLGLIILAFYSYKFFFTAYQYEENFFDGLRSAPQNIGHLSQSAVIKFFIKCFWQNYVWVVLVFVFAIIAHIWKKKYLLALFVIGYSLLYVIIAALSFFNFFGEMLTEARLLPLIFMSIIPAIELAKEWKRNYFFTGTLVIILSIGYFQLFNVVKEYHTQRILFYEQLLAETNKYPERKFYSFKEGCWQSHSNSWGIAVETLMLSSLDGKENGRTIYFFQKNEVPDSKVLKDNCTFLWVGWWVYYSEVFFNKKYFDLGCTPYREIHNPECDAYNTSSNH